jgi:hypothetical protein
MQRRRYSRHLPKTSVAVALLVDGYMTAHGDLADLSLRGAGLWTVAGFRVGDVLDLHLAPRRDLGLSFRGTAEVVWSRPAKSANGRARCGVCWAHLASAERKSLGRFMAAICKNR